MVWGFLKRHGLKLFSFSAAVLLGYLFKAKVYNRLVPASDILALIHRKQFEKVRFQNTMVKWFGL
jgi:hypothetical protein